MQSLDKEQAADKRQQAEPKEEHNEQTMCHFCGFNLGMVGFVGIRSK
jgi:hypothetical protein